MPGEPRRKEASHGRTMRERLERESDVEDVALPEDLDLTDMEQVAKLTPAQRRKASEDFLNAGRAQFMQEVQGLVAEAKAKIVRQVAGPEAVPEPPSETSKARLKDAAVERRDMEQLLASARTRRHLNRVRQRHRALVTVQALAWTTVLILAAWGWFGHEFARNGYAVIFGGQIVLALGGLVNLWLQHRNMHQTLRAEVGRARAAPVPSTPNTQQDKRS